MASQNHDQIGNRARGDRLTESLDDDQLAVAALLTLSSPFTPMLFMGEEWGASTPFAFFTSHPEPDLGRAVSEGRIDEFAQMDWDTGVIPDPQDPATFEASKLDWSERESPRGRALLDCYRRLAGLRRTLPALTDPDLRRTSVDFSENERWLVLRRGSGLDAVVVVVNLGDGPVEVPLGDDVSYAVAFATPGADQAVGSVTAGDRLPLAPHAGLLLRPDAG